MTCGRCGGDTHGDEDLCDPCHDEDDFRSTGESEQDWREDEPEPEEEPDTA